MGSVTLRDYPVFLFAALIGVLTAFVVLFLGLRDPKDRRQIVVYCSADALIARPVLAEFEKASGIKVLAVYDTEATKTTGLVQRLLAEKDGGGNKADVWWSSEPFGTIRLARAGVLEAYTSAAAEESMKEHGGWPAGLRGRDGLWYGFASRARVFVYNTRFVKAEEAPRTLADLLRPEWKGRVAIARPQFGTTRGHMAAISAEWEGETFAQWLAALKANDVRVLDGNATVVRAVGNGEVWVGLTDTDDVYAGKANNWPVELAWERRDPAKPSDAVSSSGVPDAGMGVMLIPNTVARVRGGPNPAEAAALIDFLLGPAAQRLLAQSESHNTPVDPALAAEFARWAVPPAAAAEHDLEQVADAVEGAMGVCGKVLEE